MQYLTVILIGLSLFLVYKYFDRDEYTIISATSTKSNLTVISENKVLPKFCNCNANVDKNDLLLNY